MKLLLLAAALTCVLTISAFAGDIPSVNAPTAPPPGGITSEVQISRGEIPTDGVTDQISNDALSALLTALTSVMA